MTGSCEHGKESSGYIAFGDYWLGDKLPDSQEGVSSVDLISQYPIGAGVHLLCLTNMTKTLLQHHVLYIRH